MAVALGASLGLPLGLMLARLHRGWLGTVLNVLALVPLAIPPLAIAVALDTWCALDGFVGAGGPDASLARTSVVFVLAHLPLATSIVTMAIGVSGSPVTPATTDTARLLGAGRVRRFLTLELALTLRSVGLWLALVFLLTAFSVGGSAFGLGLGLLPCPRRRNCLLPPRRLSLSAG